MTRISKMKAWINGKTSYDQEAELERDRERLGS